MSRRIRPRIAVVGGAGAMGRITVRDLAETARDADIVVADADAAIAAAARSDFGLGANIYTKNLTWALTAMQEIKAGTFWINDPLTDNDAAPFGGMRKSGMGRELGEEGLDAFRETKHVHLDFVPERKSFWFPYRERRSEIPE